MSVEDRASRGDAGTKLWSLTFKDGYREQRKLRFTQYRRLVNVALIDGEQVKGTAQVPGTVEELLNLGNILPSAGAKTCWMLRTDVRVIHEPTGRMELLPAGTRVMLAEPAQEALILHYSELITAAAQKGAGVDGVRRLLDQYRQELLGAPAHDPGSPPSD